MLRDVEILQNLRTVATLQSNQKLSTTGAVFTVHDTGGFVTSLWRSWYGEDRGGNVARVQTLFALAMLRCENLALRGTDAALHTRIMNAMREAVVGLERLALTYRDDVAVVSQLTVIMHDVEAFVNVDDLLQLR